MIKDSEILSALGVGYLDRTDTPCIVAGTHREVCEVLSEAGYSIVAGQQPNGRDIRFRSGKYETQPRNDNYWLRVDSLDDARDAYEHPEKYR